MDNGTFRPLFFYARFSRRRPYPSNPVANTVLTRARIQALDNRLLQRAPMKSLWRRSTGVWRPFRVRQDGSYKRSASPVNQSKAWQQIRGMDHPDVAAALNNLAEIYRTLEQVGEAEALYKRALYILEKTYGSEHAEVANILQQLGFALDSTEESLEGDAASRQSCRDLEGGIR